MRPREELVVTRKKVIAKHTDDVGDVGEEDEEDAEEPRSFGTREEGGDEVAEHHEGEREEEEEESEKRDGGVLEDRKKNERATDADHNELEEVGEEPGPHEREISQSHRLERLADAALFLIHDVSKDPEAGVEESDEEENGVQHPNQVEEIALPLQVLQREQTHISIGRERKRSDILWYELLLCNKRFTIGLHGFQLFIGKHIQPILHQRIILHDEALAHLPHFLQKRS